MTVEYAHSRGILHRDIKPKNIMIGQFGETLVLDWGLARLVDPREGEESAGRESGLFTSMEGLLGEGYETRDGDMIGTPAYMSPEQIAGTPLGLASDIYNLGATLYNALTGKPPHAGMSINALMKAVLEGELDRPSQVKPVPRRLESICMRALALRPEDRHPSARELAAELSGWREGGGRWSF